MELGKKIGEETGLLEIEDDDEDEEKEGEDDDEVTEIPKISEISENPENPDIPAEIKRIMQLTATENTVFGFECNLCDFVAETDEEVQYHYKHIHLENQVSP